MTKEERIKIEKALISAGAKQMADATELNLNRRKLEERNEKKTALDIVISDLQHKKNKAK